MGSIIVGVGAAVAVALVGRAATTAAGRMRSWYRDSMAGSAVELVLVSGLVGGILGALCQHLRP